MKEVILFGASGNIGQQTLTILKSQPKKFVLKAISVGQQVHLIPQILSDFPTIEMVYTSEVHQELSQQYPKIKFISTNIVQLLEIECDIIVNALSGFFGFQVTLAAVKSNKVLLNANKESFVVGGALINQSLQGTTTKIFPLDSEHCAIWQCLESTTDKITILLTASGGPFLTKTLAETKTVTLTETLAHPNWNMGQKITVDSATMFNKAFEILEAYHLFHPQKIVTLIHPQSVIHSMVQFVDGSVKAQLSPPDMHQVINYFLNYPKRSCYYQQKSFDFSKMLTLELQAINEERFEPIRMAQACLTAYNSRAIAMNAANEVCVTSFLAQQISFYQITEIVSRIFWASENISLTTYEQIAEFDKKIRKLTAEEIRKVCK